MSKAAEDTRALQPATAEGAGLRIGRTGAVVIIRRLEPGAAFSVVEAVLKAGLDVVEITADSPSACETIAALKARFAPHALVGAGTVLSAVAAHDAMDAGAEFVVAPNTDPAVVSACLARGRLVMPGAMTPTEIVAAAALGAPIIKVFPARQLGPSYFSDILAPLKGFRLVPTGGVSARNAADFLRAGAFAVGVGGSLVARARIEAEDWRGIEDEARALASAIAGTRGRLGVGV